VIEASQLHHCSVPSDYSDVAEAYYSIAWLLGYHDTNDKRQISALEKTVFDMGRNAESVRLPCFRPVEIYEAVVYTAWTRWPARKTGTSWWSCCKLVALKMNRCSRASLEKIKWLLRKVSKEQRGSFPTEMAAFCLGCLKPVQSLKRQFNKRLMIFFESYSFEFSPLGHPGNCY